MTHHDLISSYIDNELSAVQEQEFLISLAANENLRSSFRTELTLKNIVHRDESLITPPRALRASVFAAVGIAAAAAAPEAANAAQQASTTVTNAATQSSTFFKTLFATKMNALFTTLSLSVATVVGFVGHDIIVKDPVQTVQTSTVAPATDRVAEPVQSVANEVLTEKPVADAQKAEGSRVATRITKRNQTSPISNEATKPQTDAVASDPSTTSGTGEAGMEDMKVTDQK